jgi:hypothetical protein
VRHGHHPVSRHARRRTRQPCDALQFARGLYLPAVPSSLHPRAAVSAPLHLLRVRLARSYVSDGKAARGARLCARGGRDVCAPRLLLFLPLDDRRRVARLPHSSLACCT